MYQVTYYSPENRPLWIELYLTEAQANIAGRKATFGSALATSFAVTFRD